MRTAAFLSIGLGLSGCIAVPQSVTHYDPDCDAEYHQLILSVQQVGMAGSGIGCSDNCGPLAIAYGLALPASVVVSGSIVLVGNTVSWLERRHGCSA